MASKYLATCHLISDLPFSKKSADMTREILEKFIFLWMAAPQTKNTSNPDDIEKCSAVLAFKLMNIKRQANLSFLKSLLFRFIFNCS